MRIFRKNNKMTPDQKKKDSCRSYANVYLSRGKLVKEHCQVCGEKKVEMHHEDYNKPLEIKWLCREHHLKIHVEHYNGGKNGKSKKKKIFITVPFFKYLGSIFKNNNSIKLCGV